MKKYKLLKDMPNCKAGALWTKYPHNDSYNSNFLMKGDSLLPERVENNPEWFEEIKKKTWQIIEKIFRNNGKWYIKSVKRLSDGVVFTVGDEVYYKNCDINNPFLGKARKWKIDNLFIRESDNIMLVRSKDCEMVEELNETLFKVEPAKEKAEFKSWFQIFNNTNEPIKVYGMGEFVNKAEYEAKIKELTETMDKLQASLMENDRVWAERLNDVLRQKDAEIKAIFNRKAWFGFH